MNNPSLKSLARTCKILAIAGYVLVPMVLRPHWGRSRLADVQVIGFALLSLIPNRWLVFS